MSGKGKKGSKSARSKTTLKLSSFLADDQAVPPGYTLIKHNITEWSDAMAMEDEGSMEDRYTLNVVLPTAPKASRGPSIDVSSVPSQPPFTAYIGNLEYNITEEDIKRFFRNMDIVSVRLPREPGENSRLRGFGYVEFGDRESLIEALSLNNERLRNRVIKINLAEDYNGDRRGGGGGERGGNEDNSSDWRSDPWRNESRDRYRDSYQDGRRYDDHRDYRDSRDSRHPHDSRDSRDRGRRGGGENPWRRSEQSYSGSGGIVADKPKERRKLVLLPRTCPKEQEPSSTAPPASIFGGAKPVNTYSREKEVEKKLEALDVGGKPVKSAPPSKPAAPAVPIPAPVSTPAPAASIFGGAKPVDTSAREQEIERKLREQQKREEESKRNNASKNYPRSGTRHSPNRKATSKSYDFGDRKQGQSEIDEHSSQDERENTKTRTFSDKKPYHKNMPDEKKEGHGQKKRYPANQTSASATDIKQKSSVVAEKTQDYICTNKYSNLMNEDSEEDND